MLQLSLLGRLLLLSTDHFLHISGTVLLLRSLLCVPLPGLFFLGLGVESFQFLHLEGCVFAVGHSLISSVFCPAIHLTFHLLLHHLLALTFFFGLLGHDVSLALGNNLIGPLARLVDLFDNLG